MLAAGICGHGCAVISNEQGGLTERPRAADSQFAGEFVWIPAGLRPNAGHPAVGARGQRAPLILLDDVGDAEWREPETDDKQRILWSVLNRQQGDDLPTLVTTNLDDCGGSRHESCNL